MKHSDFVHLHNHSDYSLLDGASPIPAMVKKAARMEMPALALTDHGAMFGAIEFYAGQTAPALYQSGCGTIMIWTKR